MHEQNFTLIHEPCLSLVQAAANIQAVANIYPKLHALPDSCITKRNNDYSPVAHHMSFLQHAQQEDWTH